MSLEQRVSNLEKKLSKLIKKIEKNPASDANAWINKIHGTFQNDAAYRKAASLGRKWRKSQ